MRNLLLILALGFSFLYGNLEDKNIIEGSAYGEKVIGENTSTGSLGMYQQREYFKREAIYSMILYKNSLNSPEYTANMASLINLVDENITANEPTTKQVYRDSNMTITGYCLVKDDINVGKQPSAGNFLCNTNIGALEIFGNITPVNELATIIYDPAYIDFKGWRYKVIRSKVLNETRTSYNIATFVNDRKIAKIALESTSKTADVFQVQSSDYLDELKSSRKHQKVEYAQVGTGGDSYVAPIQTENTEKPNAVDYITKGAIDIVSHIVKTTADVFKEDLPYLYEIKGGSRVFIDLVIDKNGEKI